LTSHNKNEERSDINKEKATKDNIPPKEIVGISNHWVEKPARKNLVILNPGTTKVTKYKATAEETQRNKPKVMRFMGRRSKLIRGLISM